MFLPEVMIVMLWQTEYGWTFLHWAWKRPSVCCLVLPHGLNQVGLICSPDGCIPQHWQEAGGSSDVATRPTYNGSLSHRSHSCGDSPGCHRNSGASPWLPCLPDAFHTWGTCVPTFPHACAGAS